MYRFTFKFPVPIKTKLEYPGHSALIIMAVKENMYTTLLKGFGFPDIFLSGVNRKSRPFSTRKLLEIQTFSPTLFKSL